MYKENDKITLNSKNTTIDNNPELTITIKYPTIDKIIQLNDNSNDVHVLCQILKKGGAMYCSYLLQQGFIDWIIENHSNKETKFKLLKKLIKYSSLKENCIGQIFEYSLLTLEQITEFHRIYNKDNGVDCINKMLTLNFINFPFLLNNGIANCICDNLYYITYDTSIPFIQETAWFLKMVDCDHELYNIITKEIKYLTQLFF